MAKKATLWKCEKCNYVGPSKAALHMHELRRHPKASGAKRNPVSEFCCKRKGCTYVGRTSHGLRMHNIRKHSTKARGWNSTKNLPNPAEELTPEQRVNRALLGVIYSLLEAFQT